MNRPPFKRHRKRRGRSPHASLLRAGRNLLFILAAGSVYQLVVHGELTWPGSLLESARNLAAGHAPGWEHARDALEEQGAAREGQPLPAFDLVGRVVRVADGDTLSVLDRNGSQHKIRLYGIDTPEMQQAHGDVARRALSERVYQQEVGVVVVDIDDYQRKVGTVYHRGSNVNLGLVAGGHAWWYRYHAPHEHPLEQAESQARAGQRGLWAASDPIPPWDWRRADRRRAN